MEWISVEDRLPENYQEVIVFVDAANAKEIYMAQYMNLSFNILVSGNHSNFITHWMPLPEPPKQ